MSEDAVRSPKPRVRTDTKTMNAISSVRDVTGLLDCMAKGAEPDFLFFWGHRAPKDGSITKSCFSQWFEAPFIIDGVRYGTAEHFMMAEKARLFGDSRTQRQVLEATSPGKAKALGRQVSGFEEGPWRQARSHIVVAANLAKFEQNGKLGEFLLKTAANVLVEASPVDPIWGIGLAADHPDATRPDRWQGLNLLGFALMEVRAELARRQGLGALISTPAP